MWNEREMSRRVVAGVVTILAGLGGMVVTGCTDYNYNRGGNAFMEKDEDITRELENDGTPATPSREIRD